MRPAMLPPRTTARSRLVAGIVATSLPPRVMGRRTRVRVLLHTSRDRVREMRTWTLGDRVVNRMGFGAKRLGADPDRATEVLRRAVELGVNHIDTASFYGPSDGAANEQIRRALSPYPPGLVIATKGGPTSDGLARADQLRGLVEANLRQLGRDHLDLVYLRPHGLDSIAEHFGALAGLREAGLIRHLGVSNVRGEQLDEALAIAPVVALS